MNIKYKKAHTALVILLLIGFAGFFSSAALAEEDKTINCRLDGGLFDKRMCDERQLRHTAFALVPHRPNYFIGSAVDGLSKENEIYDDFETKFQLSFKVPMNKQHDDTRWLWYFGFTQISTWQMLNFEHSAPFRDTNFEPEIMLYWLPDYSIANWKLKLVNFGFVDHQSNGQVPPNSRSWNRSYLEFLFESGRNSIAIKGWKRWNERQKEDPNEYKGDDNPDIEEYVGHGEIRLFHAGRLNNVGLIYRDNFHGNGRGSIQFDWTYPVSEKEGLRVYIQYFNGYGETLLDYDKKRKRIGIGLMLADWL